MMCKRHLQSRMNWYPWSITLDPHLDQHLVDTWSMYWLTPNGTSTKISKLVTDCWPRCWSSVNRGVDQVSIKYQLSVNGGYWWRVSINTQWSLSTVGGTKHFQCNYNYNLLDLNDHLPEFYKKIIHHWQEIVSRTPHRLRYCLRESGTTNLLRLTKKWYENSFLPFLSLCNKINAKLQFLQYHGLAYIRDPPDLEEAPSLWFW